MTTKHEKMIQKLISWSLVDKKPILYYAKKYDETLVVWNGILLTKVVAMSFTIENYQKYPTPKMKEEMHKRYKQLYMTGFFGKQQWDSFFVGKPDNLFMYLRKTTREHIHGLCNDHSVSEVLGWFR